MKKIIYGNPDEIMVPIFKEIRKIFEQTGVDLSDSEWSNFKQQYYSSMLQSYVFHRNLRIAKKDEYEVIDHMIGL